MTKRDTQFLGFAKLLMRDLDAVSTTTYANIDKAKEAYELAIARRAYDLAMHVLDNSRPDDMDDLQDEISYVPDMTELPKEREPEWDSEEICKMLKEHLFPKEKDSAMYCVDLGGFHGAADLEVLRARIE